MKQKVTFEAWIENMMSPELSEIERDGKRAFRRLDNEIDQVNGSLHRAESQLGTLTKRLGAAVAGYIAVDRITDWGRAMVDSTAKYQRFQAVLENTLGSTSGARDAMSRIQDFASSTPFQIDELTDSFVKLSNQGFVPNVDQMTSLGDLASSTGKSYDQLTEAIIDAQTGEFERLKEFGIRASKSGDQVTFTFKNQQKTVDFTGESIRQYILGLGKMEGVTGSMAKIMGTTGGKISNVKDQVDQLNKNLGDRFRPTIDTALERTGRFVKLLNTWAEIPLSEKLNTEREKVNLLASRLMNANTQYEERVRILGQLQSMAPDVVKGINAEKVATENLKNNLVAYNRQMINQIAIEQMREELQKKEQRKYDRANQRSADRVVNIQKLITDVSDKLIDDGRTDEAEELSVKLSGISDMGARGMATYEFLNEIGGLADWKGKDLGSELYIQADAYNSDKVKSDRYLSALEAAKEKVNNLAQELGVTMGITGYGGGTGGGDNDDPNNGNGTDGGNNSDLGGSGSSASKVLGGISGDNRMVKNINIHIDKLGNIEQAEFKSQEDEQDLLRMKDMVSQVLIEVLNDTQTVMN